MKLGLSLKARRVSIATSLLVAIATGIINTPNILLAADCSPPPSGLVAWWPGNGNANDSVNGLNGAVTIGTVAYTPAEVEQGFSFDGGINRILVSNSPALNFGANQDFSIEAWIKPEAAVRTGNVMSIVDKRSYVNGQDVGYEFNLDNNRIHCRLSDSTGLGYGPAGPDLTDGNFHHVALTIVRNSTTGGRLYVDGQIVLTFDPTGKMGDLTNPGPLRIGNHMDAGYNSYFKGIIDEVSIYKRALASNEIAAIYAAGSAGKCQPAFVNCTPPPSGLIGWWQGEGNGIDVISGNNGSLWGETNFVSARVGQGFHLNGTNAYLQIPDSPALKPTNVTVEAWVQFDADVSPNANLPGQQYIIFKKNSRSTSFEGYTLMRNRIAGKDCFTFSITSAGGAQLYAASTTIPKTGVWYHVAGTYDRATGYLKIYVNGVLEGSAYAGFDLNYDTRPLFIGTTGEFWDGKLQGAVDEISIYNRALSTNEIAAIYAAGSAGKCATSVASCVTPPTNLAAWWPGEANTNDVVNGNNVTLKNGASFISGKVGSAFNLNGVNQYLVANPKNQALNIGLGSGFTMETWIKPTTLSQRLPILEYEKQLGTFNGADVGVQLYACQPPGSGNFYINIQDTANNGHILTSPNSLIVTGVWQHVALTYDKNSGSAKVYRNGQIVTQTNLGSFTPQTSFTNLLIGARTTFGSVTSPSDRFAGAIDEMTLYSRALTTNEISAIYAAGSAGKCVPQPAPPTIVQQPASQTVIVGDVASFNVSATGIQPFSYQWYFNGNNIAGATNSSLVLPDVQQAHAGAYSVMVANAAGPAVSSNATLLVTVPVCTTAPSGLVGWWPGENGVENVVVNNNAISSTGLGYVNGKAGRAFALDNTNAFFHVAASSNLNVGFGSGFTIETWIKPASVTGLHPILEWNNATGNVGIQFWIGQNPGSQGVLCTFLLDTNGNNYAQIATPAGTLFTNRWQHVATTYDRLTHSVRVFVNGNVVAQSIWSGDVPQTSYDLWVGKRPADCSGCWTDGTFLSGPLDELSLYNRALSTNEIQAIYAARGAGKCPLPPTVVSVTPTNWFVNEGSTVSYTAVAVGSPALAYQWQHNGSDLPDATNATLTLSNVVYAQAGNYAVVVSNPAGLVTSSNVVLRINRAPIADASASESLVISPNGTNATVVLDGSHSSDPDGDALTYAWFHTGDTNPFATGVVTTPTLPLGTNQLTLTVNDGMASGSQSFATEVISTSQAVDRLIELVKAGANNSQPLIASLRAALAAIDRSQPATAINQLEAFINKVQSQLAPTDPALAAQLIADAQAIIDALNGGSSSITTEVQITAFKHGNNGKHHLNITGGNGRIYIVETSTNMVDWTPIGVASKKTDGDYEFDASEAQEAGARFYRVVSPK